MDIYKQATITGLRFTTTKGLLSSEQMCTLSMTALGKVLKSLKTTLKKDNDDDLSFLDETSTPVNSVDQLRFDIVKDIYLTKKEARDAEKIAAANKISNEKILSLIAGKQDEKLKDMSEEELLKLIK